MASVAPFSKNIKHPPSIFHNERGEKNNMVFIELFLDETTRSFPATEIFFIFLFGYIIARNILFVHILTQLKLFLFPSLFVSAG
jgi:hypothetical protein